MLQMSKDGYEEAMYILYWLYFEDIMDISVHK